MHRALPPLAMSAVLLAGCGGGAPEMTVPPPASTISTHGVKAQLQPGWHAARKNLTPQLVSPMEILSVGTFPMRPGGACAQSPGKAYSDMQPRDALITIMEQKTTRSDFPPQPARFHLHPHPRSFECVPGKLDSQELLFRDGGRAFYAFVALGAHGPQDEVESILDSFRTTAERVTPSAARAKSISRRARSDPGG
jgi:hypothetical protein